MTPDQLAGKYPGWCPYNYCVGNPLRNIDPNGMSYSDLQGEGMRVIGRSRNSSLLDGENQTVSSDKGIKNPYGEPNYSIHEFASKFDGKSFDQIINFTGKIYGRTMGKYRYIRDPLHPENEIDMVHFSCRLFSL